ncbi:hypothetical protein Rs2_12116 [Raphanus sativus]|nr:hypothetical protein Rs2_12116 [Raphanus sativus]
MKFRNKARHPLQGSSKMARFAGVSKSSTAVKSKKKSTPLASAPSADAVIATVVAEEKLSSDYEAKIATCSDLSHEGSRLDITVADSASPITVAVSSEPTDITSSATINAAAGSTSVNETASTPSKETGTVRPVSPSDTHDYASLLKASAKLEEIGTPTEHVSGAPFVLIPDENIQAAREEFKDFIFARFHIDSPSMGRIIGVVNAIWAKTGPRIYVHNIGQGCYLLRVTNIKARESLLSRTCWNVAGYPMFVALWSPEFAPEEAPLTSAIVPVEFRNVPYLLFNRQSLSRIATAIGKPESLAPETERKENFEVAKLYVRVDLTKELPSKIISGFSSGREVEIYVHYPWLPVKCDKCSRYGHAMDKCRVPLAGGRTVVNRDRSPSRDKERKRNKSRRGRSKITKTKYVPKSLDKTERAQEKDKVSVDQDLEEGEITLEAKEPTPGSSDDMKEGYINQPTKVEASNDHYANDPDAQHVDRAEINETSEKQRRSGSTSVDRDAGDAADDGFLLVQGRKRGRRAKRNQ